MSSNLNFITPIREIQDQSLPSGCIFEAPNTLQFNNISTSNTFNTNDCGIVKNEDTNSHIILGAVNGVEIRLENNLATITMAGPSSGWFGVGFGAKSMADNPYAIIVEEGGIVTFSYSKRVRRMPRDDGTGWNLSSRGL